MIIHEPECCVPEIVNEYPLSEKDPVESMLADFDACDCERVRAAYMRALQDTLRVVTVSMRGRGPDPFDPVAAVEDLIERSTSHV